MNSATRPSQLHAVKSSMKQKNQRARVIAISSGKGGVGKSTVSLNLAIELSRKKYRVCLLGADTNQTTIKIMTGVTPQHTLHDFVKYDYPLKEILLYGPGGIIIIPAATGFIDFASYNSVQQDKLIELVSVLENKFDYILIDNAAGINDTVLNFIKAANETIIIITTEPGSLTDAFVLLSALKKQGFNQTVQLLVNRVPSYKSAKEVLNRFSKVLKKYLGLTITTPGYVLEDENVSRSLILQTPCSLKFPKSPASVCLRTFSKKIISSNKQPVSSLSDFLTKQKQSSEKNTVVTKSTLVQPWMKIVEGAIQSAPFEEAEQIMAWLSKLWIDRLDSKKENEKYLNSAGYDAAVKFASKLKI